MQVIKCLAISPGVAIGPVFYYETQTVKVSKQQVTDAGKEVLRLEGALGQAKSELQAVLDEARSGLAGEAEIFEAHLMVLEDPVLLEQVAQDIHDQKINVEYAWQQGTEHFAQILAGMDDEYMAARSADVRDVAQRVLRILAGLEQSSRKLDQPTVVLARELTPSDTVLFDRTKVLAFATAEGGPTSHVSILSKALGIPAVSGLGGRIDQIRKAKTVIVDGTSGEIMLDPDEATLRQLTERKSRLEQQFQVAFQSAKEPAITKDGRRMEVVANIGSAEDAVKAVEYGAEGVGLLRTEFLFLERMDPPGEEEQYQIYRKVMNVFGQQPVVIRTLDIGGDKPAPYLEVPSELNPFLGVRGARLEFKHPDLMRTQLRALLRAGEGRNLKIMFPMISTIGELREANRYVQEVRKQLEAEGLPYAKDAEIGIMVEVPSAALMADVFASEVDFFSIGTNDLSQYTLASDRTNPHVAHLADSLDPSVLRLIQNVTRSAHARNIWVGLCGELAGEALAAPVLLGLGVDEFSMNARAVPYVKQAIRRYSIEEAQRIAEHVVTLPSAADVRAYLASLEQNEGLG